MNPTSKLLLPLDMDNRESALAMAQQLAGEVGGFKVGLELVNAVGFGIFDDLKALAGPDVKIFYDAKFHDIPNTVAGAMRAAARRGLWMVNVHAVGGSAMMGSAVRAAGEGADAAGVVKPLVIAVTLLTSIDANALDSELGVSQSPGDYVTHLARMAQEAGCDGVVASPHEIGDIRRACGPDFTLVIPGVRPLGSAAGDQKRVMTPGEAVRAGADWLVVGRPITQAADPRAAARMVNAETGT